MTEIKRMGGIILLGLALFFALRVPEHLKSTDAHQQSLAHADYFFIFVLGGCGLVLLLSGGRSAQGEGTPRKRRLRARSISLQGLALIAFICVISFRSVVLLAGKQTVTGQVVAVDSPPLLASGRATYHITYRYTDSVGDSHLGYDTLFTATPVVGQSPINVVYSPYRPGVSRLASRISLWTPWTIGLGVFYQLWAFLLYWQEKKTTQSANAATA